jgi:magnesium transporter
MTHEPPATDEREATEIDDPSRIEELLDLGDVSSVSTLLADLRPAEVAAILEHLSEDDLQAVIALLGPDAVSSAIEYTEPITRGAIVALLDPQALTDAIATIPDDVATDVVQDLDEALAAQVMEALPQERRQELEQLLTYPETTAGGRMTGQVITVDPRLTASQTIERLRTAEADATKPFYIYVTEADRTLRGVLNMRSLITAHPGTPVTDLMTTDVVAVQALVDQEEAAQVLARHNLLAIPVVDAHERLLGTITSDDLIDVMAEEVTEDIYRMVGVHEDEDLHGVWSSVRHRLPWLMVNLVTALSAAWVVSRFENTLEQVAILAAFLPVIGGQGGNAGIQTLTIVVRSLALGRIALRDTATLLFHELRVGLVLGIATGLAVGLVAFLWRGSPWLGGVVMAGLVVNITVGALVGVLIPMVLQRFRQDPALSGGIWLTTATDLSGFFAFLATATFLIERLRPLG